MKIRPTGLPTETLPPKPREVSKPQEGEVDVRVAFSKAARALAAQSESTEEPVDLERIQRLRDQIDAGTYEIDDLALAKALIEKELQWKP